MATSGNALFDRRCKLTIATPVSTENDFSHTTTQVVEVNGGKTDNINEPGMRIQFKIEKSLDKGPNSSEIIVTNLSESRRQSLQTKGQRVLLEAGYRGTGIQRLFSGDIRTVDHIREKADWETKLKLGDGERAWLYARVSESFAPGTRAADVLKKIANATGLDLGNVSSKAALIDKVFDQGWSAGGSALRALDQLITALGKTWSIQDGALQILDPYEALDLPIPEITPDTGLIGSPEMGSPPSKGKPALLHFKSLLVAVKPGGKVRLKSSRYSGYIRIHKVTFEGDTHGGPWYSTMDGTISERTPEVDVVTSA